MKHEEATTAVVRSSGVLVACVVTLLGVLGAGCATTDYTGDSVERRNLPAPETPDPDADGGVVEKPDAAPPPVVESREARSEKLVAFARSLIGQKTFTPASLVRAVYAKANVDLPASALLQSAAGASVEVAAIRKGDLVFTGDPKRERVEHVAIFIGDDSIIHATSACEPPLKEKEGKKRPEGPGECVVEVARLDKKLLDSVVVARDVLR